MKNNKNTQGHKLPTAEEFWLSKRPLLTHAQIAIEFAKLHVEAAAKNCLEKYHHSIQEGYEFGSSEIMNSYNLNNIK